MLITLTSSTSGELIMFVQHARQLFEAIGKECTARGVFTKEQIPCAIEALRRAVDAENQNFQSDDNTGRFNENSGHDQDQQEPVESVSLGQRATPLIRLMEFTMKEGGFILWESPADF